LTYLLNPMGPSMLQYLLSHPEYAFSPPETADLCEAFDMAVAELQERGGTSINWTDERVRAALSGVIVEAWNKGERDPRQLSDRALRMTDAMRDARQRA
jgi:hypothetical protein